MDRKGIDTARISGLLQTLEDRAPALFAAMPVKDIITAFDTLAPDASYTRVPDEVRATWDAITGQYGEDGFGLYQNVTMLTLMQDFEARTQIRNYTPAIRDRFAISFSRIMNQIEDPAFSDYDRVNDLLIKDLSLCRQKMFPAGARIIEDHSGIPRSLALKAGFDKTGIGQAFEFLSRVYLEAGGRRDFYQVHTHLLELSAFNPEGWDTMFRWLAEMMEINRHVRGLFCSSWLYDPALSTVSPRLAYMHDQARAKGASILYSSVTPDTGALAKSATRRKLYEEGKYTPKTYVIIWPRRTALRWLKAQRQKDAQS